MSLETIPEDEDTFRDKLVELLRAKMVRENPKAMHRDAHPKQHGLLKAQFEIEQNIPEHLQVGVFQPGTHYDAWVRFSNQNAPPLPDYDKDIRGAAIKLMNVPGEKIALPDNNQTSQDFIVISTPIFVTKNVKQFAQLIEALVSNKFWLMVYFLFHPRSAINLLKSNKRFYSPLEIRYWSTTPYKLGDNQVVKYSLIPQQLKQTPIPPKPSFDYMREHLVEQLSAQEYAFDFCVQLRTLPDSMPIEDPGKLWKEEISPFVKVATLRIPQQSFDSPEQNIYGRDLSFNPWHSLPDHQPLGGINRARKVIYETLSKFRHEKNHAAITEPTDFSVPPTGN